MKLRNKISEKEMLKNLSIYMPYIYEDHSLLDPVLLKNSRLLRNAVRITNI